MFLLEVKRGFAVKITEKNILWKHFLNTFHESMFGPEAEQYEAVSIRHSHTVSVNMMDQFVGPALYHLKVGYLVYNV